MDAPSIACVVLGGLIVVGRGPLLVAPRATLRVQERVFSSTNVRFRTSAAVVATLATVAIMLPLSLIHI